MAVSCGVQAGLAIAKLEKVAKEAIKETIEAANIRNPNTRRALNEDLEKSLKEFVANIKEQLNPENILDDGILSNVDLITQRQIFNMIERVRVTKNTFETLDIVFKNSTNKKAIAGGLRDVLSLKEKPIENMKTRMNNIFDRIWADTLEGGTKKNPDAVHRAKLFLLDAQSGGRQLHDDLINNGFASPGAIIDKALDDGHFVHHEELNIIAANVKKLENEVKEILKAEYPNFEIPTNDFNVRIDKTKAYHADEFNKFIERAVEPHVFLGISKDTYDALGDAGRKKFSDEIEKYRQGQVNSSIDPLDFSKRHVAKNPFNKTSLKFKNHALKYEFKLRFGDMKEGVVSSRITFFKSLAASAAEKSVMSDKPGMQFVAMRDFVVEKFGTSVEDANIEVEPLSNYWRGTYHPDNTMDTTFALISLGIKQFVNAALLGAVNIRNITIDNTLFHAIIKHAHVGDSRILTALKQGVKLTGASLRGTGKALAGLASGRVLDQRDRKLTKQQELYVDAFENAGLVIQVAQPDMVMGSLRRSGDVDPLLYKKEGETKARGAARTFAKVSSWLADFASVTSGAEATNKVARIEAGIASTSLFNRALRENSWRDLSDQDRALFSRFGLSEKVYEVLRTLKTNKYGIVDYEGYRNADVSNLRDGFTSDTAARTHVMQVHKSALSEAMDEYAPLPGSKGEIDLNRSKGNIGGLILGLALKYANISLKGYQSIMKAMFHFSGLDPNVVANTKNPVAPLARALELAKQNPKYIGESMTLLAAGGMAHIWATNIKNNEPLAAITPSSVGHAIAKTPALGLVAETAQGIFWGDGLIGDVTKPVVKQGKTQSRRSTPHFKGRKERRGRII